MVRHTIATDDDRCPGALHALGAHDGLLVRVRVPGGILTSQQLAALANASRKYGDCHIDITSKANVQLRGITAAALSDLGSDLAIAELLPSITHDRIRNILGSPFSGIDDGELIDTRPFIHELDKKLLADEYFASLPPKFSFAICGGGYPIELSSVDVAGRAIDDGSGTRFAILTKGVATGKAVLPDALVDALLAATRLSNGSRLVSQKPTMIDRYRQLAPVGIAPVKRTGLFNLVPSIKLGRLTNSDVRVIVEIALRFDADLRLAPWRGIVFGGIQQNDIERIVNQLENAGISMNPSDVYRGIVTCAGLHGCTNALADVRERAHAVAHVLAKSPRGTNWTLNLAGCRKRCAMRRGADVDVVATDSGYDISVNGEIRSQHVPSQTLVQSVLAARADLHPGCVP